MTDREKLVAELARLRAERDRCDAERDRLEVEWVRAYNALASYDAEER